MRVFEKEAVRTGGGRNHRYNLSDGVMLKDNHIAAAGGVRQAVAAARAYAPFVRKIEVECETLDQVREAVEAGADIIMLDNMDHATMAQAVAFIDGRAETECSGKIDADNVRAIADLAPILDVSLKHLRMLDEAGINGEDEASTCANAECGEGKQAEQASPSSLCDNSFTAHKCPEHPTVKARR